MQGTSATVTCIVTVVTDIPQKIKKTNNSERIQGFIP